ncbi:hypothetical protein QBC39DRAFT_349723 [Podospora conica]|nr:hypothetical protein QBC39DRAFT_349723 [Schizothecium conicum]
MYVRPPKTEVWEYAGLGQVTDKLSQLWTPTADGPWPYLYAGTPRTQRYTWDLRNHTFDSENWGPHRILVDYNVRDRHSIREKYMWSLEPCGGGIPKPLRVEPWGSSCGPHCSATCHITTVCTGNCHKEWCVEMGQLDPPREGGTLVKMPDWRLPNPFKESGKDFSPPPEDPALVEMPNWRFPTLFKDADSWKPWELEFRTRLLKIDPGLLRVMRADEKGVPLAEKGWADTTLGEYAEEITSMEASKVYACAGRLEAMTTWLVHSIQAYSPLIPSFDHLVVHSLKFQDSASVDPGHPFWGDFYTFHARSTCIVYWDLYHYIHLELPSTVGVRSIWNRSTRACRCQKCFPKWWVVKPYVHWPSS